MGVFIKIKINNFVFCLHFFCVLKQVYAMANEAMVETASKKFETSVFVFTEMEKRNCEYNYPDFVSINKNILLRYTH